MDAIYNYGLQAISAWFFFLGSYAGFDGVFFVIVWMSLHQTLV